MILTYRMHSIRMYTQNIFVYKYMSNLDPTKTLEFTLFNGT